MNGDALRSWRAARGLTQALAAERFSVNRVTWAKWEGGTNPVPEDVADILEHDAVDAEVLIAEGSPAPDVPPPAVPVLDLSRLTPWERPSAERLARDWVQSPIG